MFKNNNDLMVLRNQDLTNPIELVKKNIRQYWEKDYINEKIDEIKNVKHQFLIKFLWMTGLRVSEVINVRKKDIDIEK